MCTRRSAVVPRDGVAGGGRGATLRSQSTHTTGRRLRRHRALLAAWLARNMLPLRPWRAVQRARAQAFCAGPPHCAPRSFPPRRRAALGLSSCAAGCVRADQPRRPPDDPGQLRGRRLRWPCGAAGGPRWRRACCGRARGWRLRGLRRPRRRGGAVKRRPAQGAPEAAGPAKRGLRRCGLPSCGQQGGRPSVLQFRVSGHRQRTRHCSAGHAEQHWPVHKRDSEEERGE